MCKNTFFLLLCAGFCSGATLHVPGQYPTIQAGIDAAVDGDTVLVGTGEYAITEPVTFRGKAVTLCGECGPELTTIRMSETPIDPNRASIVVFENGETAESVLQGFALMDALHSGVVIRNASRATIKNCIISSNNARGVLCRYESHATLESCVIADNLVSGHTYGGGIFCGSPALPDPSSVTLIACVIARNLATYGGGAFLAGSTPSTLINCLVIENRAGGHSPGIMGGARLINCTVARNRGTTNASGWGGAAISGGRELTNCILWGNRLSPAVQGPQIGAGSPTVTYSCIEDGWPGEGNFDQDPRFEDPANSDYHLQITSPAIDAGTYEGAPSEDIDGNLRPCGVGIDVGAYELCGVNEPPQALAGGPYVCVEGSEITFDASASQDPDGDELHYRWDIDNDGVWDTEFSHSPTLIYMCEDDYAGLIVVEVYDGEYAAKATADLTIENAVPTIGHITAPVDPVPVGTRSVFSAEFSDPGLFDTHTAVWDWGDGSSSEGVVTEPTQDNSGSVDGEHVYLSAGVYTIILTVTDSDEDSAQFVFQYLVVYDPEGGFVTGGGWINSPEGSYVANVSLAGKASFGFVSKYKRGAATPTGQTQFQFTVADLNFHSDTYDWLVIAGAKAMYKGVGTINGEGDYGFMLSAIDEALTPSTGVDLFRIKIWDKDCDNEVVYDNQMDSEDDIDPTTAIGGGSIVIHKQ